MPPRRNSGKVRASTPQPRPFGSFSLGSQPGLYVEESFMRLPEILFGRTLLVGRRFHFRCRTEGPAKRFPAALADRYVIFIQYPDRRFGRIFELANRALEACQDLFLAFHTVTS